MSQALHRCALLIAVAFGLAACGFTLAGSRPVPEPLKSVFIDMSTPYQVAEPPLETALRRQLTRRGARVEPKAAQAATHLKLWDLQERRETLSIGPDGKALEYRLTVSVRYLVERGTQPLVGADELSVQRDYSFKADQILAKEAEEAQLREYIQGEMAELLMLRVEAALANSATPSQ